LVYITGLEVAMAIGEEEDEVEDEEEVGDEGNVKFEEEEEEEVSEEEAWWEEVEAEETVQEEEAFEDAEVAKAIKRAHSPSGHTPVKKASKTRRGKFCIHIYVPTNAQIQSEIKILPTCTNSTLDAQTVENVPQRLLGQLTK
jgi:hypothetical protein